MANSNVRHRLSSPYAINGYRRQEHAGRAARCEARAASSTANRDGAALAFGPEAWARFLTSIR